MFLCQKGTKSGQSSTGKKKKKPEQAPLQILQLLGSVFLT